MRWLQHLPRLHLPEWPANLASCIAWVAEQERAKRYNDLMRRDPKARAHAHRNARD